MSLLTLFPLKNMKHLMLILVTQANFFTFLNLQCRHAFAEFKYCFSVYPFVVFLSLLHMNYCSFL